MHLPKPVLLILTAATDHHDGRNELSQYSHDRKDEAESRLENQSGKDKEVQSDRSVTDAYLKEKEHLYVETVAHAYWLLVRTVRVATAATDINAIGAVSPRVPVSQVAATQQAAGRFDDMVVADDTLNNAIVMGVVMEGSEAVNRHAARVLPREGRQCPLTWEDQEIRPAKEADTAEANADPTTATEDDARLAEVKVVVAVPDTAATEAGAGAEVRADHTADKAPVAPDTPAEAIGQAPLQKACVDDALLLPLRLQVRVARVEAKAKEKVQEKDRTVSTVSTSPLASAVMVTNAVSVTTSTPRRLETRSSRRLKNADSNANPMQAQLLWPGCWS